MKLFGGAWGDEEWLGVELGCEQVRELVHCWESSYLVGEPVHGLVSEPVLGLVGEQVND